MRASLVNRTEKIVTRSSEVKAGLPTRFIYDAREPGVSDLPSLTANAARVLLEQIVVPNLKDLRAWARTLVKIAAPFQAEIQQSETDENYRGNIYAVKQALAIVDEGVRAGLPAQFAELLAPMSPVYVAAGDQVGVEGGMASAPPGATRTAQLIQTLEFDRAYLEAYIARWPSADSTNPYTLAAAAGNKPRFRNGRRVYRGEFTPLTELEARSFAGIFEPKPESEADILIEYARAVNQVRGGVLA
jgi:hypothetical protein